MLVDRSYGSSEGRTSNHDVTKPSSRVQDLFRIAHWIGASDTPSRVPASVSAFAHAIELRMSIYLYIQILI